MLLHLFENKNHKEVIQLLEEALLLPPFYKAHLVERGREREREAMLFMLYQILALKEKIGSSFLL